MKRRFVIVVVMALAAALPASASAQADPSAQATYLGGLFEVQSLDGGNNNAFFPSWGKAGTPYLRVTSARYADGRSRPVKGPNTRYISNRVFNDINQNLFSEREVRQWGFVWGQFIDHTIGLRLGRAPGDRSGEIANIPFNPNDTLEDFTNTLGYIPFERSAAASGTGVSNALPAMGVNLPRYRGYNPFRNANLGNEFATVGYRAHSMIHGEFEIEADLGRYTQADLDAMRAQGIEIAIVGDEVELAIPLNVAFFNPNLLNRVQLGPMLQGIGLEAQYKNEEQIDNQLRSVLFQIPVPGNPECLDGPTLPQCFRGVVDLGAIDIERGRDHGMPSYNQLRRAYGLPAKTSFAAITGEASEAFPPGTGINNRNSLDFTSLTDIDGNPVPIGEDDAVNFTRRSPLAARLKAIYGSVDKVQAFAGMVAEPHVAGSDFGELQLAIWTKQFAALRDGDRFYFANDPSLSFIRHAFGIDYRRSLAEIIAANTDIPLSDLNPNVFLVG